MLWTVWNKFLVDSASNGPIQGDIGDKIIPSNITPFISQLLAFGVLVFCVTFFVYKPVKKILNQRSEYVEKHMREAEEASLKAKEHEEVSRKEIIDAKKQAKEIVEEAKKDSLVVKSQMLEEAKEESRLMRKKTEEEVELAKQKAQDDMKREMVTVALEASKAVIGRELNEGDQDRLVEDFIKEMSNHGK